MQAFFWLSTGLSTVSLIVALAAFYIATLKMRFPSRKIGSIDLQLGDIEHDIESLRSTTKRLNARIGMREAREKRSDTENNDDGDEWSQRPGETPEQWKARIRSGPLRRGARPARN